MMLPTELQALQTVCFANINIFKQHTTINNYHPLKSGFERLPQSFYSLSFLWFYFSPNLADMPEMDLDPTFVTLEKTFSAFTQIQNLIN